MPRIILTSSALQDLDEIWDYIAVEYQNPAAADSLIDEIHQRLHLVADQPMIGEAVAHLRADTRRIIIRRRYLVFYETSEAAVLVLRILHGARLIQPEDLTS